MQEMSSVFNSKRSVTPCTRSNRHLFYRVLIVAYSQCLYLIILSHMSHVPDDTLPHELYSHFGLILGGFQLLSWLHILGRVGPLILYRILVTMFVPGCPLPSPRDRPAWLYWWGTSRWPGCRSTRRAHKRRVGSHETE